MGRCHSAWPAMLDTVTEPQVWRTKSGAEIPIDHTAVARKEYRIPALTVGLEQEYLCNGLVASVLEHFRDSEAVGYEARADMIEVRTAPDSDVSNVVADLARVTTAVVRVVRANGLDIIPLALHPSQVIGEASPAEFIRKVLRAKHGLATTAMQAICSLQINVAVEDGNAALFVHNALRGVGPHFLALTANSPFHAGRRSGLLATRANLRGILLDSGWVPEDIPETSWQQYFTERAKLCAIGSVYTTPWAHNLPMRIRPDRKFCIEIGWPEVVPDFARLKLLVRFTQALVRRILECYISGEPLHPALGYRQTQMGIQKNIQEAVIRGCNGKFFDAEGNLAILRDTTHELFRWVFNGSTEGFEPMFQPPPAYMALLRFAELHPKCIADEGCDGCLEVVNAIVAEARQRFYAQFA